MKETKADRTMVEHTSPIWRVAGVIMAFGAVAGFGKYFETVGFADEFATIAAVAAVGTLTHWARKRPDRVRLRAGPFAKIAEAVRESADDIRAWTHERSIRVGLAIYAAQGVGLVALKSVIVAVITNLYAVELAVAVGCAVGALVAAPEFFASVFRRMSIPDEDPEVRGRDGREAIERGERMSEPRREDPEEQYRKNAEARFASPDGSSEGIGYYDEHGNQLSPEAFQQLVARDAQLREEEEE